MESPVKLYTLSTCSHCKAVKQFLDDHNVEYEYQDVDLLTSEERTALIEEIKQFNPYCTFPTIIIGNKVIVGFREQALRETLRL